MGAVVSPQIAGGIGGKERSPRAFGKGGGSERRQNGKQKGQGRAAHGNLHLPRSWGAAGDASSDMRCQDRPRRDDPQDPASQARSNGLAIETSPPKLTPTRTTRAIIATSASVQSNWPTLHADHIAALMAGLGQIDAAIVVDPRQQRLGRGVIAKREGEQRDRRGSVVMVTPGRRSASQAAPAQRTWARMRARRPSSP